MASKLKSAGKRASVGSKIIKKLSPSEQLRAAFTSILITDWCENNKSAQYDSKGKMRVPTISVGSLYGMAEAFKKNAKMIKAVKSVWKFKKEHSLSSPIMRLLTALDNIPDTTNDTTVNDKIGSIIFTAVSIVGQIVKTEGAPPNKFYGLLVLCVLIGIVLPADIDQLQTILQMARLHDGHTERESSGAAAMQKRFAKMGKSEREKILSVLSGNAAAAPISSKNKNEDVDEEVDEGEGDEEVDEGENEDEGGDESGED